MGELLSGRVLLVVAALALFTAACSDSAEEATPSSETIPATEEPSVGDGSTTPPADGTLGDPVPPETSEFAADWPLPGRDYFNSRAVVDSMIGTATVGDLREKWRAPLEGAGVYGNAATTPLIIGDRVVVQDLESAVRVFELETGELVWETTVENGTNIGPNGVAIGWGRVYAAKGSESVFALDLESGEELWATRLVETTSAGIDIQPQVVDGLVLVSTVPFSAEDTYTGGDRGVLHALDAETGEVVWRFDTVDSADLWGEPTINSGGGAWYTPAVDPEAGMVYWGIGNPAPFPGTAEFPNGSSRPGPNLYTNSVVALDYRTGELLWYSQVIEHDLFDHDHVHTMLVESADGPMVVSAGKGGVVVGHDIESGEIQWRTEVGTHLNDDLTELDGETTVVPGILGGITTPPATADGVVYVATLNAPSPLRPDTQSNFLTSLGSESGEIVAIEATTGDILWSTPVDGDPLGAATVVGDLVFTATLQRKFYALERAGGEIVWEFEAPGGVNGWPAVADDVIVWPVGFGDPPMLLALALGSD